MGDGGAIVPRPHGVEIAGAQRHIIDAVRRVPPGDTRLADLADVGVQLAGNNAADGRRPIYAKSSGGFLLVGDEMEFSLPGTAQITTGNWPSRYAQTIDGGVGTVGAVGTTASTFDLYRNNTIVFTITLAANLLISPQLTGQNIGPLVPFSTGGGGDVLKARFTPGTGAADGLLLVIFA